LLAPNSHVPLGEKKEIAVRRATIANSPNMYLGDISEHNHDVRSPICHTAVSSLLAICFKLAEFPYNIAVLVVVVMLRLFLRDFKGIKTGNIGLGRVLFS